MSCQLSTKLHPCQCLKADLTAGSGQDYGRRKKWDGGSSRPGGSGGGGPGGGGGGPGGGPRITGEALPALSVVL